MRTVFFVIIFLMLSFFSMAQRNVVGEYTAIDKKILQIPDSLTGSTDKIAKYISTNFNSHIEKARAAFMWVSSSINYDIENMFAINFYEKNENKISKSLKTRKGVCENYAAIFTDICNKSGVKSYVIEGYTKQNGIVDNIPHAWCTAIIDSSWFLFDPTWASGYINNGKFVKKFNNDYFKINPLTSIKSHIPFDYLWQMLNYPITNQEFYDGKVQQNKSKPYFDFQDSILVYENADRIEQLSSSAIRIESNGVKNSMIYDRLQHIKLEIENDRQNTIVNHYNEAVNYYNEASNSYNNYIQYWNKQFNPKLTDTEIQNMLDVIDVKLNEVRLVLKKINNPDKNTTSLILHMKKTVDDLGKQVIERKEWLKIYFSKGKQGRKSMFYEKKVSFWGLPLN